MSRTVTQRVIRDLFRLAWSNSNLFHATVYGTAEIDREEVRQRLFDQVIIIGIIAELCGDSFFHGQEIRTLLYNLEDDGIEIIVELFDEDDQYLWFELALVYLLAYDRESEQFPRSVAFVELTARVTAKDLDDILSNQMG